jgi:hypothetical protein
VRDASTTHNDGEDASLGTGPVGGGRLRRSVFVADELCGVREVMACATFLFPNLISLQSRSSVVEISNA